MLSFKSVFPRLHAVYPFMSLGPDLAWATEFDWNDDELIEAFARIVLDRQEWAASRDLDWLAEIADTAIDDLNDHLADLDDCEPDQRTKRTILFLRVLVTVLPMQATLALGQRGACYDWLMRGMSTTYDASRRVNSGYAYVPFWQKGDPAVGLLWMERLPLWCSAFFLNARDLGSPSPEKAQVYAVECFAICRELFDLLSRRNAKGAGQTAVAMSAIASWGIDCDRPESDDWVDQLVTIWHEGSIPRHVRPTVASVFITKANERTGQSIRTWGETILRDYPGELREHERLMFLTATIDSREQWLRWRKEIITEIEMLRDAANETDIYGADRIAARESRVDLVKPLLRTLVREEDLPAVMEVLSSWYTEPGRTRCDDNVLLANVAFHDGIAYLWPGGAWINSRTDPAGTDAMRDALLAALSIETDPDKIDRLDESREGIPDYPRGRELEWAMQGYSSLGELAAGFKTMARPRSLLVFPSLGDPLQALLGRELDIVLPLEVSLAEPLPDRTVRRISIWPGSTYYTQFEIDALRAFAQLHGWEATVFDLQSGGATDFRRFYEQPEPDVLWVAGHGEFKAHRPKESGLILDQGGQPRILPMEELAGFAVPSSGRRLLVLNTCSGATTQGMAGLARIGIGQSIVQPAQAVIGHLWPASQGVSLAFAMLFASHLNGDSFENAFARTMNDLREPKAITGRVSDRLGFKPEGLFRIERDVKDLDSILAWGSPVFLT